MLDEVARILAAYQELRDSRLNDVLEVERSHIPNARTGRMTILFYLFWTTDSVCVDVTVQATRAQPHLHSSRALDCVSCIHRLAVSPDVRWEDN